MKVSLNLAKNFPWARWNHTLHGTLYHSCELIKLNGDTTIGELSEEPLEANNKLIRNFLNAKACKCDQTLQLTDCMNRTLERSHPEIRARISQFRPAKRCTICESTTHTARSHYKVVGIELDAFDSCVNEMILSD